MASQDERQAVIDWASGLVRRQDLRATAASRVATSVNPAARIAAYANAKGPCSCGEARGHVGWLLCALASKPTRDEERAG